MSWKNKNCRISDERMLIYTVVFIVLAIVLILLLVFMFRPGRDKDAKETAAYTAGVYTSSIEFQGQTIDVQVVVDEDHINSVSFVNLDESVRPCIR